MIRVSIDLPTKHRLDLSLTKRRGSLDGESLMPDFGEIKRAKKGSKLSRFFRHIFEHKRIKKVLGANLVFLVILTSFLPQQTKVNADIKVSSLREAPVILKTKTGVSYPVENIKISQGYRFFHPGVDFDGKKGDKIQPVLPGRVEEITYSRLAYGNSVIVNHGNGMTSLYAHLSKIYVSERQEVTTSTEIGEMGSTGRSSGDHLHLEIRDHGKAINPLSVLPAH